MASVNKAGKFFTFVALSLSFLLTDFYFKCSNIGFDDEQLDLLWNLSEVDSKSISKTNPRDEFFFVLQPWSVIRDMNNASFSCHKTKSTEDGVNIVVFVKSAATYRDRRDTVRNTWGKISHFENIILHVVFIVGMSQPEVQISLNKENEQIGDILQFIGVDDYRHIGNKVIAGMQWAKEHLPPNYFYATADDDFTIELPRFAKNLRRHVKIARQLNPEHDPFSNEHFPILCVYKYRADTKPVRDKESANGKYYLDRREFPVDLFPPFCLGGWYLMPADRVTKLYDASRTSPALAMDDVWITGVLRLRIKPSKIEPINTMASFFFQRRGIAIHLEGDFGEEKNITQMLYEAWKPMWREILKHNHCIRTQETVVRERSSA